MTQYGELFCLLLLKKIPSEYLAEQRANCNKQQAKSNEQRAKSNEQRTTSEKFRLGRLRNMPLQPLSPRLSINCITPVNVTLEGQN